MSKKIKMSSLSLNIRLHPHSENIYSQYISEIFKMRVTATAHGDRLAMISMIDRSQESDGVITGIITTFIKIREDGAWFNSEELQEATEEQISEINIPRNLFPNAASFFFYFDLKRHQIHIQSYSKGKTLTPNTALKIFSKMSEDVRILSKFQAAKITIIQSTEGLKKLFSLPVIKEVKITILKPNSDIFADDFEEKIEAHMNETHARKVVIVYNSEPGQSINTHGDIEQVGKFALENGSVEVKGRDETGAVQMSSAEFPRILQDKYDPETESEHSAFMRIVSSPARRSQK